MGRVLLGCVPKLMIPMMGFLLILVQQVAGIRFVIDREECFSHKVEYEGDNVHLSFVVIKSDAPWSYGDQGVDLVVIPLSLFFDICWSCFG